MQNEKVLGELRSLLKLHIETNSNMVGHLSIMDATGVHLNSFVDHIMGSVHMFPPSPTNRESLFYKTLYAMVEEMAAAVLYEAIEERRSARDYYHERIRLVDGKPVTLYRFEGPV